MLGGVPLRGSGAGFAFGVASGFTSFVAHAGGPPFQAYVLPLRLDPLRYAATAAVFFAVINLSRKAGIVPSTALAKATVRLRNRFGTVERLAASNGLDLSTAGLEALDTLWEEAKRREAQDSRKAE